MQVTIIGGGVIGLAAAYYLSKQSIPVTVLERGQLAAEASASSGGVITSTECLPLASPHALRKFLAWSIRRGSPLKFQMPPSMSLLKWSKRFLKASKRDESRKAYATLRSMGVASLALFEQLAHKEELLFEFEKKDILEVFLNESAFVKAASHPLPDAKVLDPKTLREVEPSIAPSVAGGICWPDNAKANPGLFSGKLTERIKDLGGEVREFVEVLDFKMQNRRISSLRTTHGEIPCDEVVMAAGPWSAQLGKMLGLYLPVQPAKGYKVILAPSRKNPRNVVVTEKRVYVSRQADDTLRCVAALEFLGYDKSIDPKRVKWVEREVHAVLPDTQSSSVREVTCAFRPCTPDELPLLGRVEGVENLIVAVGHCRYGFTMAPISGVLITDIIMQKKPMLSIDALSPSRFTN